MSIIIDTKFKSSNPIQFATAILGSSAGD